MWAGLRGSLIGAIVTATAGLVLTIILLEDPLVEHRATRLLRTELEDTVDKVVLALRAGEDPDRAADRIGAEQGARVILVAADGRLLGDTARDGADLGGPSRMVGERAVERARSGGRGVAITEVGGERTYHAARLLEDGRVVIASRRLTTVTLARRAVREILLVGGIIAIVIAVLQIFVMTRTLVRPVEEFTQAADALAAGKLDTRLRSSRSDELGTLARSLDAMADQLSERLRTLRAEEARLRTVLDSMVEAVFVTDRGGTIVLTNAALDRLVGADVRGRTPVEAVRSPELHEAVRGARAGNATSVDVTTLFHGIERTFSAHVATLPGGVGVVGVLHDVTELMRADRVRRDFVANASHELRTPLTVVRGFAETLEGAADLDPPTAKRFARKIVKHTLRLERLVDDLLALSRAETPEEDQALEPVELGPIAAEVVRGLEEHGKKRGVTIVLADMDEVAPVLGNARAIDQIVTNLVDNAIKYTPAGGTATVRAREAGDRVVLEVQDTGPGIASEHLPRLFERFYRVDKDRSHELGGTGLGLSIVKHFAARMGAEARVESEPGHGATFSISFTRARQRG